MRYYLKPKYFQKAVFRNIKTLIILCDIKYIDYDSITAHINKLIKLPIEEVGLNPAIEDVFFLVKQKSSGPIKWKLILRIMVEIGYNEKGTAQKEYSYWFEVKSYPNKLILEFFEKQSYLIETNDENFFSIEPKQRKKIKRPFISFV